MDDRKVDKMKNKGLHQYRFSNNPVERKYALAWERINTQDRRLNGKGILDYLLAEENNRPAGEVTPRDRVVASTVIQWLGSPVGQNFVKEIQKAVK